MSKTERVNLALEPKMLEELNKVAEQFGLGKSEIIRDGIIWKIKQLQSD